MSNRDHYSSKTKPYQLTALIGNNPYSIGYFRDFYGKMHALYSRNPIMHGDTRYRYRRNTVKTEGTG